MKNKTKAMLNISILLVFVVSLFLMQYKNKESKALVNADRQQEKRQKGLHCVAGGQNLAVEKLIKGALRDPGSFQHINTTIASVDDHGKHFLIMEYRAKNGFGGYNPGSVAAQVYQSNCEVAKIISTTN